MDPPNDRPARVTLSLRDGRMLAGECLSAQGGPDRPFTEGQIKAKAEMILREAYPDAFGLLAAAVQLDPSILDRSWRGIVEDFG